MLRVLGAFAILLYLTGCGAKTAAPKTPPANIPGPVVDSNPVNPSPTTNTNPVVNSNPATNPNPPTNPNPNPPTNPTPSSCQGSSPTITHVVKKTASGWNVEVTFNTNISNPQIQVYSTVYGGVYYYYNSITSQGSYEFLNVQPGKYVVRVVQNGTVCYTSDVLATGTPQYYITQSSSTVTINVSSAPNNPGQQFQLYNVQPGAPYYYLSSTATDISQPFNNVPAGTYVIRIVDNYGIYFTSNSFTVF